MRRVIAAGVTLCLFPGCSLPMSGNVTAAVTATISQAQQDVQNAITLWGIAKGLAGVAEPVLSAAGNGTVSVVLAGLVTAIDPVVSEAQTALDDATTNADALEALAGQIKTQANVLTLNAAPAIKAVPAL